MPHLYPQIAGCYPEQKCPGPICTSLFKPWSKVSQFRKSRNCVAISSQLRSQFRAHQAISGPPGAQAHCGGPRVDGVASPYACDRARGIFAGRQDGRMCTKGGLGGILTGQQDGRMCTKGGPGGPCRAGAWPHVHTFTEGRYRALKTRPSQWHPTITKTQVKKRKGLFKTQKKSFIGHLCDAGLCGTMRRGVVRCQCVRVCVCVGPCVHAGMKAGVCGRARARACV